MPSLGWVLTLWEPSKGGFRHWQLLLLIFYGAVCTWTVMFYFPGLLQNLSEIFSSKSSNIFLVLSWAPPKADGLFGRSRAQE